MTAKKTLKAQNVRWIWTTMVADALALVAMVFPAALDQAASLLTSASKIAGASIAPLIVLLLTSILPSSFKAVLVFWRVRDVLPAHRAFSVHGPADPRIDLQRLRAAVGDFPAAPRDQNSLWYRLLKKVDSELVVSEAHRHFLLFRDLAAVSVLLALLAPGLLYVLGAEETGLLAAFSFFAIQYVATAIAARHHGVGLVTNVLALHGAADDSKPRKPTRRTLARSTS